MSTKSKHLTDFRRSLHRWYAAHGRRDLPWRLTRDAYAIYVSEIMLQQTQVETVRNRYYSQFLKRFPSLAALAAAKREDVLSAWQGLGYYNRAIHLHEAARRIQDSGFGIRGKQNFSFFLNPESRILNPSLIETLMSLPGIGRNTAHAIAAFAYHQPVAVMEANVKRVLSRIFALQTPAEAELWEKAALLLDTANPFDHNQAMMDIGAMVCTKRAPKCGQCPASRLCKGKAAPELYPAPKRKKAVPVRKKHIVVYRNSEGKFFAAPRITRFLQGLYHFVESDTPPPGKPIGHIRQQYSHFTLEAEIYAAHKSGRGVHWHTQAQLKKLPMSMAEKKIMELLDGAA